MLMTSIGSKKIQNTKKNLINCQLPHEIASLLLLFFFAITALKSV